MRSLRKEMEEGERVGSDYQRRKNNPYYLPRTLYRRVLSVIRDYERQKKEINDILFGTAERDGVAVAGGMPGKPTENIAIRLSQYENDVEAVESALHKIPFEYREGIFRNIVRRERFPETAHYNTWLTWRQRYIWHVAKGLNLI